MGQPPGEWHSALRPRERERVWRGVTSGDVRIVVGARSALFLPWTNLGLIVVDEEHEPAYKQDDGVCYHARRHGGCLGQPCEVSCRSGIRDAFLRKPGECGPGPLWLRALA